MRKEGRLAKWNDDRGFGFIQPDSDGAEVFVHISAFPHDGQRPKVGERLSYEVETTPDGKQRAVRLVALDRQRSSAAPRRNDSRQTRHAAPSQGTHWFTKLVLVALVAGAGFYGYRHFSPKPSLPFPAAAQSAASPSTAPAVPKAADSASSFRCDGRTHCSQMTSCAEAKFFLKNCPGTEMDGDGDGKPCEKQWCTGLFD